MSAPRLLLIQYGDYLAGLKARDEGLPETYRAQQYSLDVMDRAIADGKGLVICLDAPPAEGRHGNWQIISDHFMPGGSGIPYRLQARRSLARMQVIADIFEPTHMIVRTPGWVLSGMGNWALKHNVHLLPILADYFPTQGILDWLRLHAVRNLLADDRVRIVGNHNIPASRTMANAGIAPDKIVPWDWPPVAHPADTPPRERKQDGLRLVYAGTVSEEKGFGDLLEAIAWGCNRSQDFPVTRLHIYGDGPSRSEFSVRAGRLGLDDIVRFHGTVPNTEVRKAMAESDFVIVPSRASYPEGLPNVIYEAFETRTPLVCSNHPAFKERLQDGRGCRLFQHGDPHALACALQEAANPLTYRVLSESTLQAWESISCPVLFGDLVQGWLDWTMNNTGTAAPEFLKHTLAKTDRQEETR